uniref:Uncharacterized protein n=1 Tax=Setaria italica TaxID=4555 RepID=K3ZZP4_SETIT
MIGIWRWCKVEPWEEFMTFWGVDANMEKGVRAEDQQVPRCQAQLD